MLSSPIGRLRLAGLLEGASFLLLLGVAMPLKYAFDLPLAVRLVGWAHGVLFVAFVYALAAAAADSGWPLRRVAWIFLSGLLPFGPFVMDAKLRREGAS